MSKLVTFHIGMPKAASTFIANNFFSNLKNLEFYGGRYNHIKEQIKNSYVNNIPLDKIFLDKIKIKNVVISDEAFLMDLSKEPKYIIDTEKLINFIKTNFSQSKILIIFREQKSFIDSWYTQKKNENKILSNISLNKLVDLDSLNYSKIVETFKKNFGKNFEYFFYEEISIDPVKFEIKVCKFLNTSIIRKINYKKKENTGKIIEKNIFYKILKKTEKLTLYFYAFLRKIKVSEKLTEQFRIMFLNYPVFDRYKDKYIKYSKTNFMKNNEDILKLKLTNKNLVFSNKEIEKIYLQ